MLSGSTVSVEIRYSKLPASASTLSSHLNFSMCCIGCSTVLHYVLFTIDGLIFFYSLKNSYFALLLCVWAVQFQVLSFKGEKKCRSNGLRQSVLFSLCSCIAGFILLQYCLLGSAAGWNLSISCDLTWLPFPEFPFQASKFAEAEEQLPSKRMWSLILSAFATLSPCCATA